MENKGLNFLAGVGIVYVFAILFAYSFITISGPLITGNAVANAQNDSSITQQMQERESLYQTIYIVLVIFFTVLFIWTTVYIFMKKSAKNNHIKPRIYKPVRILRR